NKGVLNLTAVLGSTDPGSLNGAHQNVATSLNNAFNFGSGVLPANFVNIFGLTGSALTNALTQPDGEAATGAERSAFQLTNQFMTLMLDPYVDGRGSPASAGYGSGGYGSGGYGGAGNGGGYAGTGYGAAGGPGCAPGPQGNVPSNTSVFGLSKDCALRGVYEPRWSAWGSAFGSSSNANGNTSTGSNNVTAST